MPEKRTVHAPYNFVPFSDKKPLLPYSTEADLPAHDRIIPDLKTGEIHITLRAETPVFVSDGSKTQEGKQALHFFRRPNGDLAIPGSSIRGMVRENMQILGYGRIQPEEDFEDYRVYFREIASARDAVGSNVKQYYRTALDIQTKRSPDTGKSYSRPEAVHSGYLCMESGKIIIRPTKEPCLRISRKHPDVVALGELYARTIPISFKTKGEQVIRLSLRESEPEERKGILLFTGKAAGKPNHLYLFPEPDYNAPELALTKEDILAYKIDLEQRRNALKGLRKTQGSSNQSDEEWLSFWKLPEKDGESKPVFYIARDGHVYFGMSAFLRIGYPHTLAEGLPPSQRDPGTGTDTPLDFPHAILGFAEKETSYRSRVSFGDFSAEPGTKEDRPVSLILANPKPSYYPGYVRDGKDYTQEDFQLRGYKQYWLKDVQPTLVEPGKENVGSTICPLPAGTVFHGTVRFKNLTDIELGLLLWSLRLEENCFQTVGMGKPYGYGRIKLGIDTLCLLDYKALYGTDLSACAWNEETGSVQEYIQKYDAYAAEKLYIKKPKQRPSITSRPEIQDFFYMKSTIRCGAESTYMELGDYQNIRVPLPSAEEIRMGEKESVQKADNVAAQTGEANDPWAALKHFKGSI